MRTPSFALAALLLLLLLAVPGPGAHAARATPLSLPGLADSVRLDSTMVRRFNRHLNELIGQGRPAEAVDLAWHMLSRCTRDFGPVSYETTKAVEWVTYSRSEAGLANDREELDLAEQGLALRRRFPGKDSLWLARSLGFSGNLHQRWGHYDLALARFLEADGIRQRRSPADDPDVAVTLGNRAQALQQLGRYEEARAALDRSVSTLRAAYAADTSRRSQFAQALRARADLAQRTGHFAAAESLLAEAYALHALDPRARRVEDLAGTLEEMSQLAWDRGDMARAAEIARRALALRQREQGESADNLPRSLRMLGRAELGSGDAAAARRTFEVADSLEVAHFGATHWRRYDGLVDLASALSALGDDAAARDTLRRAVALGEAALGPGAPEMSGSRLPLAAVLIGLGQLREADALLVRSIRLHERENPDAPAVLVPLLAARAELGLRREDLALARTSLERAFAIADRLGEAGAAWRPRLMGTRAELALREGRAPDACADAAAALRDDRASLGPTSPAAAADMARLARALLASSETAAAFDTASAAESLGRTQLRATIRGLVEREALLYTRVRPAGFGVLVSALLARGELRGDGARRAWESLVRSRAQVLDEVAARHHARAARRGSPGQGADALEDARQRLANLTVREPAAGEHALYRAALDSARAEVEALERRELAAGHAIVAGDDEVDAGAIERAVPPGAALVSFALVSREQPRGRARRDYVAFVVRAGEAPVLVPLGSAARLDSLVQRWRDGVARPPERAIASAERDARARGFALRARLWDPLRPALAGARLVLVVPDGALHLVPLAALPANGGRWLVEAGPTLHVISSERDLVEQPAPAGHGLLALGDPDFDASAPLRAEGAGAPPSPFRGGCGTLAGLRWRRLPAAAAEASDVCALWRSARGSDDARLLTGAAASERAFKLAAPGHRVLHVATHGFFLSQGCEPTLAGLRGAGRLVIGEPATATASAPGEPHLAGLALAGANRRAETGPDSDDGILTSDELAALDLRGVDWVVLSACDTGLGDTQAGEGVLGLRRALRVAGAGSSIVSLWPVGDAATRAWMHALYAARFEHGASTAESVRAAARAVIEARRAAGRDTHPFSWAGFIASGDWR